MGGDKGEGGRISSSPRITILGLGSTKMGRGSWGLGRSQYRIESMSYLSVKNLTYTYPGQEKPALSGIDLEVEKGEFIAIVGPNAAGKSTLAKALKGLIQGQNGSISIGSEPLSATGPDRRVGLLLSNPENQLITSIVEEDVAFGLEAMGLEPEVIKERVGTTLHGLGIGALSRALPHKLSGGEQQMVALAGVLAPNPEVLVLDEPTSFLDPAGRERVFGALTGFLERGGTTLLVTHNMEEAARAHRIALLIEGKIACVKEPWSLFDDTSLLAAGRLVKPFIISLSQALSEAGYPLARFPDMIHDLTDSVLALIGTGHSKRDLRMKEIRDQYHQSKKDTALEFEKVAFSYNTGSLDEREVLAGVDLDVVDSELTVLCGANGSGKSTLLQLSNGLLLPDSGCIRFRGQALIDLLKGREKIPSLVGLLFQNPERQVFSETVFDDIAFGPYNLGLTEEKTKERVSDAIGWAGIDEDLLSRSPFTLSGGQLRRVAIAGVIALRSRVLVLDEPTDGLDPASSALFLGRVKKYAEHTGTSVLMATHSVPDPPNDMDNIAFLMNGRIGACGLPDEVLFSPSDAFPGTFLPLYIRMQREIADAGYDLPELSLNPEDAIRNIVKLISSRSIY